MPVAFQLWDIAVSLLFSRCFQFYNQEKYVTSHHTSASFLVWMAWKVLIYVLLADEEGMQA